MPPSLPKEPFSRRFGVRPVELQKPDEVPGSAKGKLVALIDELRTRYLPGAYSLGPRLSDVVGRASHGPGNMNEIRELIHAVEWWQFYDVCEELVKLSNQPDEVAKRIDSLFTAEGLLYKMTASGIEWRFAEPAVTALAEAKGLLLSSGDFQGPSEQWEKAKGHLARRPPDPENCVKDAVGALEGVARILSQRPSCTLGQIIRPLAQQLGIHGALATTMSGLYGYRGDEQAIAHGATARLQDLVPEAELVLHWCAASIVYLVKKADHQSNP